jgi:hypothetical protein
MSNFLKHSATIKSKPLAQGTARKPSARPGDGQGLPNPIPVPEVVEGNEESDWGLWEDSVAFQDSQMQSALPWPDGKTEIVDPFASVRRRSK